MKTTDPNDFRPLLELFSLALQHGLIKQEEIIRWADEIVAKDSEPDYFIIELSLCGYMSINDTVSFINGFTGQSDTVSERAVLGLLYNQYLQQKIGLDEVVNTLNWFGWESHLPEEERNFFYPLAEAFYLASEGIHGNIKEVEMMVLDCLEMYKDLRINNFRDWARIEEAIIQKMDQSAEEAPVKKKWWKF